MAILYEETFDGSTFFSSYVHKQFPASYSWTASTQQAFQGSKSGRLELRETDPIVTSSGVRCEILFPEHTETERWYSFAVYFPSATYAYDSDNDIINQWHQEGSPAMSFRTIADRFLLKVGNTKETRVNYDLGVQTKDVWHTFVFHVIHSFGSGGLVEVFHNGVKKLTVNGGNMYNLSELPRWKVGLYKDAWGLRETDTNIRIFFYDNIRLGDSTATLEEMLDITTPTIPELSVVSFTLVNASTEKDVLTIKNGQTIKLKQLKLSRITIRANILGIGSVKFELSGKQTKTYTDNEFPYSLHGDDGDGNYYYGDWGPPPKGSYTLTATPYTGADATGTAGTPKTITFSIAN